VDHRGVVGSTLVNSSAVHDQHKSDNDDGGDGDDNDDRNDV
jgi:hypothetical protein